MNFTIHDLDLKKIDEWLHEVVYPKVIEHHKKDPNLGIWLLKNANGMEYPYYGAIGGDLTYQFTPTSLGVIIKVLHVSGAELDITDYSLW